LKAILEIFPGLIIEERLCEAARHNIIEKLVVNNDRTSVSIFLSDLPDNVRKDDLITIEREIKRQLFNDIPLEIKMVYKLKEMEPIAEKKEDNFQKPQLKSIQGAGEKRYRTKLNQDASDGLLYGKPFETGEITPLSKIEGPCNDICINAKIFASDKREYQQGQMIIYNLSLTDLTDSISMKLFLAKKDAVVLEERFNSVKSITVRGNIIRDQYDRELTLSNVFGIKKSNNSLDNKREDKSEVKRVELHCHTKMSELDGMIDVSDLIKQVTSWGHKAVAITDHGVVHAFTGASNIAKNFKDFKLILGMEGYLVDDLKGAVENSKGQAIDADYVVFDIETTGLNETSDDIIEIGAVRISNNKVISTFQSFVNPHRPLPFEIKNLTGIDDIDLVNADGIEKVLPEFLEFAKDSVIVAHNAEFDTGFIQRECKKQGHDFNPTIVDTVILSRVLVPKLKNYKLDTLAKYFKVELLNHHRADQDAECTAHILLHLLEIAREQGVKLLEEFNKMSIGNIDLIRGTRPNHIILLAKNDIGRVNLYKLVSMSHIKYYNRSPRIPKSELIKHREGLIVGSACAQGELYDLVMRGKSDETLEKIASFYDYLEIQPISNNLYLTKGSFIKVKGVEGLRENNKKIVSLGKKINKPVVATTDAHFLNREDELYRKILLHGRKFKDFDNELPVYIRTTDEMLEEFSYLGEDTAYEVVVKNSNLIADLIEKISPVRPDKCPPIIENSDIMLREICYNRAKEIYGDPIPDPIGERLEKELTSIIGNGYAVMYIIARKLVKKSNEDGYMVGSRGSVGSSLVATMAEITEVNPMPPHYYCSGCHYSDFDSDLVKKYLRGAGCDMPDMLCPVCGQPLSQDGFDIPFETFLGFKGDKEPDIDLNFSGEYQATAHKYTEEIFGEGNTFKAGTVGTIAEKTAIGYVKGYFEEKGIEKRRCELLRMATYLTGIKRTSGQHPGGIVVLPKGEDITTFTPVQHPANDVNSPIITTHFDYHSIEHNLLKLDILGHDIPSTIKMLEDLTGFKATDISLADKSVLSLFNSTEVLGIKPEDIGGCVLGVLGMPEFGTDFVMQMLIDTKPKSFSDLVLISGLSHGTNVWTDNAQILIKENITTLSGAICTRDDIMLYLIEKGLESSTAFTIMEQVRKGKGLKTDQEAYMLENGVPKWYIESCKKISYMFPKAHAVAYVMMSYRIGYYKIFYPLAYYAAYYSIRTDVFDYMIFCSGKEVLNKHIDEYLKIKAPKANEKELYKLMCIVREMYARGIEFLPIDLYKAKATEFQVIDGKIMPALNSIAGLGITAAKSIELEAKEAPFTSIEEFKSRTSVDQTSISKLIDLGILKGLPAAAQLSIFDFM